MATLLLGCFISVITKLVARFGGHTENLNQRLRLLKWKTVLIVLTVLLSQLQQAAMCGNLEAVGLWIGLAISELVMALFHYSADA